MKRVVLIQFFLFVFSLSFGQCYVLKNEEILFSFKTKNGKKIVLAKDINNEYIIYRFGTSKKIELEYPKEKSKNSWNLFTYDYYHKPGGPENNAMYLNSVYFKIGTYQYSIFSNVYLTNEKNDDYEFGVSVFNSKNGKTTTIKGTYIIKGTLDDFKDNNLLKPKLD